MRSNYVIGQMIEVLCDDDKSFLARIVGTATIIGDEYASRFEYPTEIGSVHVQYVVKPEYSRCGWLWNGLDDAKPIEPHIYVSTLVVDSENMRPAPIYVNVYERDRGYGGPEEGGWWYDIRVVLESNQVASWIEAETLKDVLENGEYKSTGDSSSVVYRGGDYYVTIEHKKPESSPQGKPVYE
jgi:hypothetical protein